MRGKTSRHGVAVRRLAVGVMCNKTACVTKMRLPRHWSFFLMVSSDDAMACDKHTKATDLPSVDDCKVIVISQKSVCTNERILKSCTHTKTMQGS